MTAPCQSPEEEAIFVVAVLRKELSRVDRVPFQIGSP